MIGDIQTAPTDTTPPVTDDCVQRRFVRELVHGARLGFAGRDSTTGGSGVAVTRYTTERRPTPRSRVPVATTYTRAVHGVGDDDVKYASWDNAGNTETVNTQVVSIASGPPPGELGAEPVARDAHRRDRGSGLLAAGLGGNEHGHVVAYLRRAHRQLRGAGHDLRRTRAVTARSCRRQDSGTCAPAIIGRPHATN